MEKYSPNHSVCSNYSNKLNDSSLIIDKIINNMILEENDYYKNKKASETNIANDLQEEKDLNIYKDTKSSRESQFLQQYKGKINELIRDQNESKKIQSMVEELSSSTIEKIYSEVSGYIVTHLCHTYSNYFMHKLFILIKKELKKDFLNKILESFTVISCSPVGTFCFQRIIETVIETKSLSKYLIQILSDDNVQAHISSCCYVRKQYLTITYYIE